MFIKLKSKLSLMVYCPYAIQIFLPLVSSTPSVCFGHTNLCSLDSTRSLLLIAFTFGSLCLETSHQIIVSLDCFSFSVEVHQRTSTQTAYSVAPSLLYNGSQLGVLWSSRGRLAVSVHDFAHDHYKGQGIT